MVACGCTVSPPMASICLRACWSMGSIKDRYIHYEKAGDEFVGRTVTGISSLGSDFAISPVYWDWSGAVLESEKRENMTKVIEQNLARKEQVTNTLWELLPHLFASLCYHYRYLDENLHSRNRLRASPIFVETGVSTTLRTFAVVKYPWEKTRYTPYPTGIPPHVIILSQFEEMKVSLKSQSDEILKGLTKELDERHIGNENYRAEMILKEMQENHEKFLNQLKGISSIDVEGRRSSGLPYFGVGGTASVDAGGADEGEIDDINDGSEAETMTRRGMISWTNIRDGSILLTPRRFSFPSMTFRTMLTMWFCGDISNNIPPYRVLRAKDVKEVKGGKQALSNMRYLVKHVIRATVMGNRPELNRRGNWTVQNVNDLYMGVKHFFAFPSNKGAGSRRFETLSWKTYYTLLSKRKGKLLGET